MSSFSKNDTHSSASRNSSQAPASKVFGRPKRTENRVTAATVSNPVKNPDQTAQQRSTANPLSKFFVF